MATPCIRIHLLVLLAVWLSGCMDKRATDQVTGLASAPAVSVTQDRLPTVPATRASALIPKYGDATGDASGARKGDDSRWECEGRRRMICDQQWVGAQEKCQRMTCERIAGFWLLRDPGNEAPNRGDFRSAIQERSL